ncbi:MAG: M23 family metallopeptidase [Proteobacteria bacterium]|nr:M23 family metallopeptidase [Burkholderiales bacterium]
MNVIIVSGSLGSGKTIALNGYQAAGLLSALSLCIVLVMSGLQAGLARLGVSTPDTAGAPLLGSNGRARVDDDGQTVLRDSLDVMATKLGEMQARLLRIDTLGERLARSAGFKPQEFMFEQAPGRGGPVPAASTLTPRQISVGELGAKLELLSREVDDRAERLGIIESIVSLNSARRTFVPSGSPIASAMPSSNFGWRIDPFTGRNAFHEGVDFFAEAGTPIVAAASGVVTAAEFHPQYGHLVEIDHGNDLLTRYAHASALHVKVGDIVRRGQQVGNVGSTGRSTGPHLHFEVRHRGAPQNPSRFLTSAG